MTISAAATTAQRPPRDATGRVYHRPVQRRGRGAWLVVSAALAVSVAPSIGRANPCPCREQWVAGRHLYVSEAQKDVRMESEALLFAVQRSVDWLHDVVVEVSVDYVLVNGGARRETVIGFPIGRVHEIEGEVSSFQVHGDGVGARVVPEDAAKKSWVAAAHPSQWCESDDTGEGYREGYDWFLWKQTLRPGVTHLRVRYLQRWFIQDGEVTAQYVLRTAARWGDGRIGKLRIELRDPDRPPKVRWKATPAPTGRSDGGRRLFWSLTDHRPTRDLELRAVFVPGPEDRDDDG
jgi:hypothetical protein